MANQAVISASGGLDSTMVLMKQLSEGKEVKVYAFDYGQKHTVELNKLATNINYLRNMGYIIGFQVINLRDCFSDSASSLHESGGEIPKGDYDVENQMSTVVENRNIIFSSIIYGKALAWAKKSGEHVDIALGIHAGDHSVYPDTTQASFEAASYCFKISNWNSDMVEYIAPFVNCNKNEVLAEGIKAMISMGFTEEDMDEILKNTHSCYDPDDKGRSCGVCGTCKERLEAFKSNNLVDPILYYN
jgi:7-cyano-7-deazaguanine synthase